MSKSTNRSLSTATNAGRDARQSSRIRELEARVETLNARNDTMMEHYARMWAFQMGSFAGRWTSFEERQLAVDFVERWTHISGVSRLRLLGWLGISESKFFNWKRQVLTAHEEEQRADAIAAQ